MTDIIPAILPRDYRDLKDKLSLAAGHVPLVEIDVTDGTLTGEASWPHSRPDDPEWQRVQNEDAGLPYWEDLNFEAHLMVRDPEARYEEWVRAGTERLIIQFESFDLTEARSAFLDKLRRHFGTSDSIGIEIGLGVGLETAADAVLPHVLECDFIQLMAIPELGRQGEPFSEEVFAKIEKIRYLYPETIIAVDGGVDQEKAERLREANVDRLVVGSAIWEAESPLDALEDLILATE